tara:strand:+ start:345 stop:677 length:333 start_codon:yes stop_codon:yes gene_type:complete
MIKVKNKFNDSILEITFSKESETKKEISIPVATDVNFKMLVDYLLEVMPENDKLEIEFENFDDQENVEKLGLIKDTINEIYEKFNLSIINESNENVTEEETGEQDDDLPF